MPTLFGAIISIVKKFPCSILISQCHCLSKSNKKKMKQRQQYRSTITLCKP